MIKFPPLAVYTFPVLLLLVLIRKFREKSWGYCKNKSSLEGKVAIVTGANSGIGYEVAKELVHRGANVVFACRSLDAASLAILKIQSNLTYTAKMVPMVLDLASLKSVRNFVVHVTKMYPNINILVNNAGVSYPDSSAVKTQDGFEIHMGTNHLGHFLLTNLLLPQLKSGNARIIVVSSRLHQKGKICLEHPRFLDTRDKPTLYANSKLANVYFCRELAKRTANDNVNVYAVCPGWVYTGLFRNHHMKWYKWFILSPIVFFFMRTPKQGAQTLIYCATDLSLSNESGSFYRDCRRFNSPVNFDDKVSEELWARSEKMTCVHT